MQNSAVQERGGGNKGIYIQFIFTFSQNVWTKNIKKAPQIVILSFQVPKESVEFCENERNSDFCGGVVIGALIFVNKL